MSSQLEDVRCQDCKKTAEEIERAYPGRIGSIRYDHREKRILCSQCWASIAPSWGASGR